jgi:hypothetical protein
MKTQRPITNSKNRKHSHKWPGDLVKLFRTSQERTAASGRNTLTGTGNATQEHNSTQRKVHLHYAVLGFRIAY